MKKTIVLILSLTAVLGLNIYYRAYPVFFPQFKSQAREIVKNHVYQNAWQQVNSKFKDLPEPAKASIVAKQVANHYKDEKKSINKETDEEYERIKDRFQDMYGQTYLLELDCWHWARYVDNVVKLGHPGDKVVDGVQIDRLMLAPDGGGLPWNHFLFYLSANLYKFFSLFFKNVSVYHFLFYLPLFFIIIFLTTLYFICYSKWGNIAAVVSCLFVGLAQIFLPRSSAGWFDMDILSLFFPLVIVFSYLSAYRTEVLWKKALWVILSGFLTGIFSYTWVSWIFIAGIILVYELYCFLDLASSFIQYREKDSSSLKSHIFCTFLFLAAASLWVFVFSGKAPFQAIASQIQNAITLNKPLTLSIWPNVFSTVGELKRPDYLTLAKSVGGLFVFLGALVSMLILIINNKKYDDFKRDSVFILIIWFMVMFFVSFRGVRFTMFLLIPLGICLGMVFEDAIQYCKKSPKKALTVIPAVLLIALFYQFNVNAEKTARYALPLMTDPWYKVLTDLKNNTETDAVLNSWWDFGDWFKTVAQRRVIFDGQTQDNPRAFWMARVLITDNEKEAMAILRMLNNGGNKAFDIINSRFNDPVRSIYFLHKLILADEKEGQVILSGTFTAEDAGLLAGLLYKKPAVAYFIVDPSMPGKINPISFIGNWDFLKAYIARLSVKKDESDITGHLVNIGFDKDYVSKLYQESLFVGSRNFESWIARRFNFYSQVIRGEPKQGAVFFENGSVYNPKDSSFYTYAENDKSYKVPISVFIWENSQLIEKPLSGSNVNLSVMIMQSGGDFYMLMLDRELAKSIFVSLFFFNGENLGHFKPFAEEREGQGSIKVFKIKWD